MIKKILLWTFIVLVLVVGVLAGNLLLFNLTAGKISEGEPVVNPDPEKMALLVIDIQEGTTGTVSITDGLIDQSENFIREVNGVIEDMYEAGYPIIYVQTEVVNPLLNVLNSTLKRGSEGFELDSRLLIKPGYTVVKRKNDAFYNTELDQILQEEGIGKLMLAGLDAMQCVWSTALAAQRRGYYISLVENATISETPEMKETALRMMKTFGMEIVTLD